MRCASCGEILRENDRFCTHCGHPVETSSRFGGGNESVPPGPTPVKSKDGLLYAIIALLAMLLLVLAYLNFGDRLFGSDSGQSPNLSAPVMTVPTASVTSEPSAAPTPTPTPSATPEPVPSAALEDAIEDYLHDFIRDTNNGEYWDLYGSVQSGSPMETEQKDFMEKSRKVDRYESLLDYRILSMDRVSDTAYNVTVVEAYEIWQDDDPEHSEMKQRCTYRVNRQSDGSWKIYSFEAYDILDEVKY